MLFCKIFPVIKSDLWTTMVTDDPVLIIARIYQIFHDYRHAG